MWRIGSQMPPSRMMIPGADAPAGLKVGEAPAGAAIGVAIAGAEPASAVTATAADSASRLRTLRLEAPGSRSLVLGGGVNMSAFRSGADVHV
jgi:hypothetical protein